MTSVSKGFDEENPPRHQVRVLTNELWRDVWKVLARTLAKRYSLAHLFHSCLVPLLSHS